MKMRELEAVTGVHRETIRVYLRRGLLPEPQRNKPNVADYTDAHVEGIRTIRRLQKQQGLTLPQIKAALSGSSVDTPLGAGAFVHLERLVSGRLAQGDAQVPLGTLEARNPRVRQDARDFERLGVIEVRRSKGRLGVSRLDAELLAIWADMRAAGFSEENGFAPEVLRLYLECANALAAREVGAFLDIVTGRLDENQAATLAVEALNRMLPFFGLLRTKAVLREFAARTGARSGRGATAAGRGASLSVPVRRRRR
jgi:DNA-binding transcriptional MerR regulator